MVVEMDRISDQNISGFFRVDPGPEKKKKKKKLFRNKIIKFKEKKKSKNLTKKDPLSITSAFSTSVPLTNLKFSISSKKKKKEKIRKDEKKKKGN